MNTEQEVMLMKWITERQYANIEDSVVSMMIEKCSFPRKEEQRRKKEEVEKQKQEKVEQRGENLLRGKNECCIT